MSERKHNDWRLTYGTDGKGNGFQTVDRKFRIVHTPGLENVWDLLGEGSEKLWHHSDILLLMKHADRILNNDYGARYEPS